MLDWARRWGPAVFARGCQEELWAIIGDGHGELLALQSEGGILEVEMEERRTVEMMMRMILTHCPLVRLVRMRKSESLLLVEVDSGTSSLLAYVSVIVPDIGPIALSVTSSSVLI
jgi:hypothetical protein